MKRMLLTIEQLATILQISVKSIRRAYPKGDIPVERICRFVRFDLNRVKQAMQVNGHGPSSVVSTERPGQRSATGGGSRRRTQRTSPRLGKTGASIARKPQRKK